jgi:hypothetical protein
MIGPGGVTDRVPPSGTPAEQTEGHLIGVRARRARAPRVTRVPTGESQ